MCLTSSKQACFSSSEKCNDILDTKHLHPLPLNHFFYSHETETIQSLRSPQGACLSIMHYFLNHENLHPAEFFHFLTLVCVSRNKRSMKGIAFNERDCFQRKEDGTEDDFFTAHCPINKSRCSHSKDQLTSVDSFMTFSMIQIIIIIDVSQ